MKRFMRSGKEISASRGQGDGCSGDVSTGSLSTPQLVEDLATKASPTPNAVATHATPTNVEKQTTKVMAQTQLVAKHATTKHVTSKYAAAKQEAAKQAAAKQEAAKQAAAKQAAAKQEAAKQEAAKQAAAKQEAAKQEAAKQAAAKHAAAKQAAAKHAAAKHAAQVQDDLEVMTEELTQQVVDEEVLVDTPNATKNELIPNVFWFSKPTVVAGVTESFKAHYNHPYMNWTEVPLTVRDRWFSQFKLQFTWKPEYEDMVREDYEKKAKDRLKDLVNKASKVPLHKRVPWMTDNIRRELIRKREDPEFVKRSIKAKKNRCSNQSETSFDPGHRQGSISTIEVAERLSVENNGVLPLAADVYEKTHGLQMPDGENMLIGDRSKKTMDEYKRKLAEYTDEGVTKAPDEVFLEVVGGRKKGKVYGLGSASSMFYKSGTSSQTKKSTHDASVVSQLSSQLEECKKIVEESRKIAEESKILIQAKQEEHEKEKGEWKKEKEELVANMTKVKNVANEVFQLILQERSFNPNNPKNGGGSP